MWKVEMGMREINFRAWNEVEGFLDTAWSIDFEHRLVCHRAHNQSDLDDCVLMQYTGLQDKNGREIYEGDIIALEVIKGVKIKVPVKFENGSFNIHEIPGGYGFSDTAYPLGKLFLRDFGIEAIGNIYENPELLEVKGNE